MTRRSVILMVVTAAALSACGDRSVPSASSVPVPVSTPAASVAGVAPSASAAAGSSVTCPEFAADPSASLGPEFDLETFENDAGRAIAAAFVAGLEQLYAGTAGIDPCQWFTGRGWQAAVGADARLREAVQGETTVRGDLVLRVAFDGTYDLRRRPPVYAADVIFDTAAGALVSDVNGGGGATDAASRTGLHVEFRYNGHRWLADHVAPVTGDDASWTHLPSPLPPTPACTGFQRDPDGTGFDETAGDDAVTAGEPDARTWCDADGLGRVIRQTDELAFFTRFPCDRGHAAVLSVGHPLGAPIDPLVRYEYVQDPAGEFLERGWLTAPFQGKATLPKDAAYTGWTNGNIQLWVSPSEYEDAVYIRYGDKTERWPRAAQDWGVTDCN
jgi:hypothetical protein